jgi:hypothetical protein
MKRFVSLVRVAFLAAAAVMPMGLTASAMADASHVVKFRLPTKKSAHFDDKRAAGKFSESLKQIGCDVKTESHGNHLDVTYRCAEWGSVEADSDEAAHRWESWLKKHGFETAHKH